MGVAERQGVDMTDHGPYSVGCGPYLDFNLGEDRIAKEAHCNCGAVVKERNKLGVWKRV